MGFFKCRHQFKVIEKSNALQQDSMGYPLRLCIVECNKCGKSEQMWIDTNVEALEEVDNGKSFILKWE
jgi:hypothetical protein